MQNGASIKGIRTEILGTLKTTRAESIEMKTPRTIQCFFSLAGGIYKKLTITIMKDSQEVKVEIYNKKSFIRDRDITKFLLSL